MAKIISETQWNQKINVRLNEDRKREVKAHKVTVREERRTTAGEEDKKRKIELEQQDYKFFFCNIFCVMCSTPELPFLGGKTLIYVHKSGNYTS